MVEVLFEPRADGELTSAFFHAVSGRQILLKAPSIDKASPLQALPSSWRHTSEHLSSVLENLAPLEARIGIKGPIEPNKLLSSFRSFIYAATEVFDVYSQIIPDSLSANRVKSEKRAISDYRIAAGRMRSTTSTLCNRLKHNNRQMSYTSSMSISGWGKSAGYMITRYKGDEALECDDEFHPQPERSTSFRKTLVATLHELLRVDSAAAKLVYTLSDNADNAVPNFDFSFGIRKSLDQLLALPILVTSNERHMFNSIVQKGAHFELVKVSAQSVPEPTTRTTVVTADGVTRSFSFH